MSAHGSPALVEWDAAQEQATPGELATLLEDVDGVPRWRWWLECQDAPAMLRWAAARVDRRVLVLATCDCAETVLHLVPEGENRPHIAVAAARAWCRGDATLEDVRAAYAAAYAEAEAEAYSAAAYYAAGDAAYTAYAAAYAAAGAADAAADAAYTAAAGAAADAAADASATHEEHMVRLADVVRARITWQDLMGRGANQGAGVDGARELPLAPVAEASAADQTEKPP